MLMVVDSDHLKVKMFDKLKVEDLRDLMLVPNGAERSHVDQRNEFVFSRSDSMNIKFSDVYDFVRILGAGSFGLCAEVKEISTGRSLALKIAEWDQ